MEARESVTRSTLDGHHVPPLIMVAQHEGPAVYGERAERQVCDGPVTAPSPTHVARAEP